MQPNSVPIDLSRSYPLTLTGADIVALMNALGELPHKVAGPLEAKIVQQVAAAVVAPPQEPQS